MATPYHNLRMRKKIVSTWCNSAVFVQFEPKGRWKVSRLEGKLPRQVLLIDIHVFNTNGLSV